MNARTSALFGGLVLALLAPGAAPRAARTETEMLSGRGALEGRRAVAEGVVYWRENFTSPPRVCHVLRIDLDRAPCELSARSGKTKDESGTRLETVDRIARRAIEEGAEVLAVVNGDQWFADSLEPMGSFVLDGQALRLRKSRPALLVGWEGQIHVGRVSPRGEQAGPGAKGEEAERGVFFDGVAWPVKDAIGGWPLLLSGGRPVERNDGDAAAGQRAPRTAVGSSSSRRRAFWVVVDGRRRGYSVGATTDELTRYLASLGATDALCFDGGGSSTMWIEGDVVNRPSDLRGARGVVNALLLSRKAPRKPR